MSFLDRDSAESEVPRDTRFAYRRPGPAWLAVLLLLPALLALVLTLTLHDRVEDHLTQDARASLLDSGVGGVVVSVSGRDASVSPDANAKIGPGALGEAKRQVAAVDGIRTVTLAAEAPGSGLWVMWGQLWALLLLAFALGSAVVWVICAIALPSESALEAETGLETEGVLE